MKTLSIAAAVVLIAASANAETLLMDNEGVGTSNTAVTQISEGHLVMVTQSVYEGFSATDNPMTASTGTCNGTMELMAGKLSGGGHCVYSDKDGDNWVVNWIPDTMTEKGAVEGNWVVTGGSGKYDGATGSGTFSTLTNQETGKFVNNTKGSVTLK